MNHLAVHYFAHDLTERSQVMRERACFRIQRLSFPGQVLCIELQGATVAHCAILVGLSLVLTAFAGNNPGKVIHIEDSKGRYVELREGSPGYVLSKIGQVDHRPDLRYMREVHGKLDFISRDIYGLDPRIVIETGNKQSYQVVYQWGDQEALKVITRPLGLVITQEYREIQAITIRVSSDGHRLKPAEKGRRVYVTQVCSDSEGRSPLDGITAEELARFLEIRYLQPVVNMTSLTGSWSILLSRKATSRGPSPTEKLRLDDLGLELRWEKVKIPVTVVKDKTTGGK